MFSNLLRGSGTGLHSPIASPTYFAGLVGCMMAAYTSVYRVGLQLYEEVHMVGASWFTMYSSTSCGREDKVDETAASGEWSEGGSSCINWN